VPDLVEYYKEYYREQTPETFDDLFRCMLDYDFSSYKDDMRRICSMRSETRCLGESCTLRSGGSISGSGGTLYDFGPNFKHICWSIEKFLRLGHQKTILLADPGFGSMYSTPLVVDSETPSSWYDLSVTADWTRDRSIEVLEENIDSMYSEWGRVNISSLFNLWLFFTNDPSFRRMASRNASKLNALINSDGPVAFNDIECRTHDQMMEWSSCTNFYQCDRGHMHFLPIFFNKDGINSSLINLKRSNKSFDDLFVADESPVLCDCGKNRIPFSFIPHADALPKDFLGRTVDFSGLPKSMWPGVLSFQILQDKEDTLVFYSCRDGADLGLSKAYRAVEPLNLGEMQFVSSKYFMAGRKCPIFWRGTPSAVYDFYERRVPWLPRS
jgi:hypothetical protein